MTHKQRGPWHVISTDCVYDNPWIRVFHHSVAMSPAPPGIYGTVHFKNIAVGVVPVDSCGYTFLVGQHRFPIDSYSWEIPEGGGEFDVDPIESGLRELAEETGLRASSWTKLIECNLSNSVSDERAIAFLVWDLFQGEPTPDPTEQISIRRLPLREAFQMVEKGDINDGLSVLALQAVQLMLHDGRLPFHLP